MITSAKPRGRCHAGERNPVAKLTDEQIVAIFLSTEPSEATAKQFGVHQGYVCAIWRKYRRADATAGLTRPDVPKRKPLPFSRTPKSERPTWLTPEVIEHLREHAPTTPLSDLAFEIGMKPETVARACRKLGIECFNRLGSHDTPEEAEDDYEPAPRTDSSTLEGPPGSYARIRKLRERLEQGVELWDYEEIAPLPRCAVRFETAEEEAVL